MKRWSALLTTVGLIASVAVGQNLISGGSSAGGVSGVTVVAPLHNDGGSLGMTAASAISSGYLTSTAGLLVVDAGIVVIGAGSGVNIQGASAAGDAILVSGAGGNVRMTTNSTFSNSGAGANGIAFLATNGYFYSGAASGNQGFTCATEGCRFDTGPDTRITECGTSQCLTNNTNGTAGSGTGITMVARSALVPFVHKITVAETALTAAATTQDVTIWTVPAKAQIERVIAETTTGFTGGSVSAMTVMCGPAAGSNAYLLAGSVFTATLLGDVVAEMGAGVLSATLADIPSFSGTTALSCRFTSTNDNVVNATAGSTTFYVQGSVFP